MKVIYLISFLFLTMDNTTVENQISSGGLVEVINPCEERITFKVISIKDSRRIRRQKRGKRIANEFDKEESKLYLLEDSSILHIYSFESAHLYQSMSDFNKIYSDPKVDEFFLFHGKLDSSFNYMYFFKFKRSMICSFLEEKIHSMKEDTTYKVNESEKLYHTADNHYIIVNDKKSRLRWFPDEMNFINNYKLLYLGEVPW